MSDPQTAEEWQEAVDGAAALRAVADCKMYGLIEGGPNIDVRRCDEILERGETRGVRPSKPVKDLAIEMITTLNWSPSKNRRSEAQQRRRDRERLAAYGRGER